MTEVASLTARIKIDGAAQAKQDLAMVAQGMKGIAEAAAAAKRSQQVATQNIRDAAADAIKTDKQLAAEQARTARQQQQQWNQTRQNIGLAAAAVGLAGKKIYEFGRSGAQIEYIATKFGRLSDSVGTTSKIFMADLRNATRGTVSDFNLMTLGSQTLQLGLASNAKEATHLAKVMTGLGMDVGEVTLALANQSKRRLDQLGLSLSKFNEIEKRIKKDNPQLSKEEAFKQAFLETADITLATTGNMADTDFGKFQRFQAQTQNLIDDVKIAAGASLAPIADDVSKFALGIRELQKGERIFDWGAMMRGDDSWVQQGNMMSRMMGTGKSSLWDNKGRQDRNRAIVGLSGTQNYTAMAYAYGVEGAGAGVQQGEGLDTTNYEVMYKGASQLTAAQEKLGMASADLNEQLRAQQQEYAALVAQGYNPAGQKLREYASAIKETKSQIAAVGEQSRDTLNNMLQQNVAVLASEEERGKKQLDLALATGEISKEAYNQQNALLAVADAYAQGKISADQAAKAMSQIEKLVQQLDGLKADVIINLIVNGALPSFEAFGVTDTDLQQSTTNASGDTFAFASGGHLQGWSLVGERGPELISPKGYVYNNPQTRAMLNSGYNARGRAIGGLAFDTGEMVFNALGMPVTSGNIGNIGNKYTSGGSNLTSDSASVIIPAAQLVDVMAAPLVAGVSQQVNYQTVKMQATFERMTRETNKMVELLADIAAKVSTNSGIAGAFVQAQGKYS